LRTQFERDYNNAKDLAVATALAVYLPKGFISKTIGMIFFVFFCIFGWHFVTSPGTPAPLSMVKVHAGEVVDGISYHVSQPDGNGRHVINITNDRSVEMRNIRFLCESDFAGSFELFVGDKIAPMSRVDVTRDGITSYPTACRLKSFETYAP
jgi:hypothetical protein